MNDCSQSSRPYSTEQRREAAEWFVIIHEREAPDLNTLQSWLAWLDRDEGNKSAFEAMAAAWHGVAVQEAASVPTAREIERDEYDGSQPVSHWVAEHATASDRSFPANPDLLRRYARRRRWQVALAAGVLAAVVGVVVMFQLQLPGKVDATDEFATRVGEQIELTLADGSRVWLGPQSTLRVEFTAGRRNLQLLTGEAFFSVSKDPGRPFTVHSAGGDITAVGTAFNVRDIGDQVMVTVSEGVVTVSPGTDRQPLAPRTSSAVVRVASGQQATYTPQTVGKDVQVAQSAMAGERARWRDGILVYRDEPLGAVVQDVARYSQRPLEVRDPALANLRYSGVVYVDALDEWINALTESFPARIVDEENRKTLHLR